MVSRSLTVILAFTLLAAVPAAAADEGVYLPEADPTLGVVTRLTDMAGTGWESEPAVAGSARFDRFLAVWSDQRDGEYDIYAQKVNGDGTRVGTNFPISPVASSVSEGNPDVVWNPKRREFLVVWADDRDFLTRGRDIWAQWVKANGALECGPFLISDGSATGNENLPAVSVDPVSGRYLVVWQDDRDEATRGTDVYGQLLNKYGWRIGGNFRISGGNATGNEIHPAVAADPTGTGFMVVWRDGRVSGGSAIFTQRVTPTGKTPGGNVRASDASANWATEPDVAAGADGIGYLVVWSDAVDDELLGDVYGRRLGIGGSTKLGVFKVSGTAGARDDDAPSVAWDEARGRWVVVWWEHELIAGDTAAGRASPDPAAVYGRRIKPSGKRAGPRFLVAEAANTYTHMQPDIGWSTPAGRHLVVWYDDPAPNARGSDIYGVTSEG